MKSQDYKNILDQMHEDLKKFSATCDTLSGYRYEKRFREITDEYNKMLFQASQGEVSPSKNEKHSVRTSFGKVTVKKKDTP